MASDSTRPYTSPLRDQRTRETRGRILDALAALMDERLAHEVTTREIAERAGVSQPTVYRHFPDRTALHEGLVERLGDLIDAEADPDAIESLDDFVNSISVFFASAERHHAEARADAILNADPRALSASTRQTSQRLVDAVHTEMPDLASNDRISLAAVVRCLGSSQTWHRMREEFGVPGTEAGPVVRWAMETLLAEARTGTFPGV